MPAIAAKHHCPPYCHPCADLRSAIRSTGREIEKGEDVLPMCYGNVHYNGADWKSYCRCEARTRADSLNDRLAYLEKEVEQIKKALSQ